MVASRKTSNQSGLTLLRGASLSPIPAESAPPVHRDDAKVFLREFTRELFRELSPVTRFFGLLIIGTFVAGLLYLGRVAYTSYRTQQQTLNLTITQTKQLEEHEQRIAHLREQANQTSQQILDLTKTSSDLRQGDLSIFNSLSLPTRLWTTYSNGICLIAGSYVFIDRDTGRPLRYPELEQSEEERLLTSGTQVPLTAEGKGTIFELDFVGTGFHVGDGYVLTNRHIAAEPWAVDKRAQFFIAGTSAIPRLKRLLAYFPNHHQPVDLKLSIASNVEDVAVCRLEGKQAASELSALPLDSRSAAVDVGKAVVLMGYPTGPNRLLALLSEGDAVAIENQYGASLPSLLGQLAKRQLIKPLTTQGHITDLYKNRIVFDAATTVGSSGSPVFGESGRVIGITFAIFVDDGASNFAVPISSAIEELRKAGWRPAEQ